MATILQQHNFWHNKLQQYNSWHNKLQFVITEKNNNLKVVKPAIPNGLTVFRLLEFCFKINNTLKVVKPAAKPSGLTVFRPLSNNKLKFVKPDIKPEYKK